MFRLLTESHAREIGAKGQQRNRTDARAFVPGAPFAAYAGLKARF